MKRIIYVLLLTLVLSACAGAPAEDDSRTTPAADNGIIVWIQGMDDVTGFQNLLDEYSRQSGELVSLVSPLNDSQLTSALTGENSPDVLVLNGMEMVHYYATAGYLNEITGVDTTSFFQAPLSQCQIHRKLYCLPWTTNFYSLYWNKDLFETAGLEPESPPETLEQLVEFADKLTRFGLQGQLEQVGFMPDKSTSHLWIYTYLHGGFWYSEDLAELSVNSQPVKDALLWESQFYSKYDGDLVSAFLAKKGEDLFVDGSIAMVIAPAGMDFPEDLNVGVSHIPFPGDALDRTGTFLFGGNTIIVPKNVDSQKTIQFIEWMISPEISARVACVGKIFSANREGLRDPCFSDRLDVGNYIPMLESTIGYVRLSTPASPELETAIGQVEKQVLFSGADPGPLLEQIFTQLEARYLEIMNPQ